MDEPTSAAVCVCVCVLSSVAASASVGVCMGVLVRVLLVCLWSVWVSLWFRDVFFIFFFFVHPFRQPSSQRGNCFHVNAAGDNRGRERERHAKRQQNVNKRHCPAAPQARDKIRKAVDFKHNTVHNNVHKHRVYW